MTGADEVKQLFAPYARVVDEKLLGLFQELPADYDMYGMMRYFMGFADEDLKPLQTYGGKRFRSGLALLLADMYGVKAETLEPAVALELFHNFTLIHDDIEDNDALRRGRPTVWKLWGVPHAINAGDAQMIMVSEVLNRGCAPLGERGFTIAQEILSRFREVTEGQYLDFTLTDLPLSDPYVTEEHYFSMLGKKTSVLVGIAAKTPGLVAELSESEQMALWEYGYNLGVAYQLCDDCMSIWGEGAVTGKDTLGDLKEKKKTLPVLWVRDELSVAAQERLTTLYQKPEPLTHTEAEEVKALLDSTTVHERVRVKIDEFYTKAKSAVNQLSLDADKQKTLIQVMDVLLPETRG